LINPLAFWMRFLYTFTHAFNEKRI
jgi:hypothetical protein